MGFSIRVPFFAILAGALALPAVAEGPAFSLKLGGHFNAAAVAVDQDEGRGLRSESVVSTGEIYVQGWTDFDFGVSAGARFEFELERDNRQDPSVGPFVSAKDDLVDEAWIYAEGDFGRVEFGQQDGAADQMSYFAPSVSKGIRINNPDIYLLECAPTVFCPGGVSGQLFAPNGLQLRTDVHVSEDYTKVVYYTPRFGGFQLGVSYTPELARSFKGFSTRQSGQVNQQSDIWEFGLNYGASFSGIDVGLSAAYLTGTNENPVNTQCFLAGLPPTPDPACDPDDVREIGFGALVAYRNFSFGGSYRRTNVLGGAGIRNDASTAALYNVYRQHETEIFEAGLKYTDGPWSVGLNYVAAEAEVPLVTAPQKGEAIEIAAGVVLGPGISLSAGYQHYEFQGPLNSCGPGGCDTTDAGVFFLETNISF